MIQKITILGCGWLGLPLGKFLAGQHFDVKGSTTHLDKLSQLDQAGIKPFLIPLNPVYSGTEMESFLSSDLIIINIPPSLRTQTEEFHLLQMKGIMTYLKKSPVRHIIYLSSTSVYPDLNREVKEEDVVLLEQSENKTLFHAEEIFRKDKDFKTIIVRCAGLAGEDRNLVKHFAGKKDLKMGNAPVNLIHREDVIGIIHSLILKNKWGETYNICAPVHPLRKDLYPTMAEKYGYPLPLYDLSDQSSFKKIAIEKLQRDLDYKFKFPDPYNFSYK